MKCKQCGKEYDVKETQRVYGDADWTNTLCSAVCHTEFVLTQSAEITARCSCGNTEFNAHQVCRMDVVIDGFGNWLENRPNDQSACYDADNPHGPFTCTKCKKEYEELVTSEWWNMKTGQKIDFLVEHGIATAVALVWVANESDHRMDLQKYIDIMDHLNS